MTKSAFSSIHFKMYFFKNFIKRTFCSTSLYLMGKKSLNRPKIKEITNEKEKKDKRVRKMKILKGKGQIKIRKEKKRKRKYE